MGSMTISIPDDIEIVFRRMARLKYGEKQGKLSRLATEAFKAYIRQELPHFKNHADELALES